MSLPVLSFGQLDPLLPSQLPAFPTHILPTQTTSTTTSTTPAPSSSAFASSRRATTSNNLQLPTTITPSTNDLNGLDIHHVARAVLKAKRVAVVCGAGISTATGIPDFRSGAGLFKSLKEQHPDARLNSGKDLFDVGLFSSEANAAIFYNMIAELKKTADRVEPTAFHEWLKELDDDGKLFRVYTQNIDALEEKAGLSYGLGDPSLPLAPRRAKSPVKPRASTSAASSSRPSPGPFPTASSSALQQSTSQSSFDSSSSYPTPRPSLSPTPPPQAAPTHTQIPRCIPLHGHLSTLSCSACKHVVPTSSCLEALEGGSAPACPQCMTIEVARTAAGGRSRGVGLLRPDVVLYGEEHKDGERVGEITRRDLMGARPDLLIVVGTTLKVKGTKRLVRELAKVTRPLSSSHPSSSSSSAGTSSTSSKRARDKPPPINTIYLNYDFPTPSRDWEGLFDVWMRGDIQGFVKAVREEKEVLEREGEVREAKRMKRMNSQASSSTGAGGRVSNGGGAMGKGAARSAGTTAIPPPPGGNKFARGELPARPPPRDRTLPPVSPKKLASTSASSAASISTTTAAVAPTPIVPPGAFHARLPPLPSTSTSTSAATSLGSSLVGGPIMPFSMMPLSPKSKKRAALAMAPPPLPAAGTSRGVKRGREEEVKEAEQTTGGAVEQQQQHKEQAAVEDISFDSDSSLSSVSSDDDEDEDENESESESDDEEILPRKKNALKSTANSQQQQQQQQARRRSPRTSLESNVSASSAGTILVASTSTSSASSSSSKEQMKKRPAAPRRSSSASTVTSTSSSASTTSSRRASPRLSTSNPSAPSRPARRLSTLSARVTAAGKGRKIQELPFRVTKRGVGSVTGTGRGNGKGRGKKVGKKVGKEVKEGKGKGKGKKPVEGGRRESLRARG